MFQLILSQLFGFGSFYYFIIPVVLILEFKKFNFKIEKKSSLIFLFLVFTFLLLLVNLFLEFSFEKIIMFLSIIWIPLILFFISNNSGVDSSKFFKLNTKIAVIAAIVGIIEFHFSRNLFGLLPVVGYEELYENFTLFYRTRSFLYSIQINALFLALSLILILEFKIISNKFYCFLTIVLIIYAMILTGSRIAILLPLLYYIVKFPIKSILVISPLIFLILVYFINQENILSENINRQFELFSNFTQFISNQIDLRFSKQFAVLEQSNLILGNGIGSTYSGTEKYLNPESYYVQIYSEFGLIGLIFLISAFVLNYFNISKKLRPILLVMFISGFFVHGLSSPYLFMFWLIFYHNENSF